MRAYPNIEKSAFRAREYVGYANGRVFHIRKVGRTLWECIESPGRFGYGADQEAFTYFRANGLDAISARLASIK